MKVGETLRTDIVNLECDHEEADTRILLHAKHAAASHEKVVIYSPNTDVAITAVSMANEFKDNQFCFLTGKGKSRRMLDINLIQKSLGTGISSALIGIHCFTGCDSTSAFYGKGKKSCI